VLSTDPFRPVALTERGPAQARALGAQLANVPIDLAVCSRLLRAHETMSIALGGRALPVLTDPGFDAIRAGDLDGEPIQAYWDWLGPHTTSDRMPHGESLDDALRRYAGALQAAGPGRAGHARHHARAGLAAHRRGGRSCRVPHLFDENAVRRAAVGLGAEGTPPPVNGKPHDPSDDVTQAALQGARE
jgi:Histidine phosphatase superfamily (branch 1)